MRPRHTALTSLGAFIHYTRRTCQRHGQHAANLLPRGLQAFSQILQAFLQLKVRREASSLGIILVMVYLFPIRCVRGTITPLNHHPAVA